MLSYFHSYFTTINLDPSLKHTKKKESKYIYRDELDEKATPPNKLRRRAHHKTAEAKSPLLQGEHDHQDEEKRVPDREPEVVKEEKKGIRVKVRMTKDEAVRLLSKCKEGGLLEFSDVAHELNRIPTNRISIVDSPSIVGDQVLYSIAE